MALAERARELGVDLVPLDPGEAGVAAAYDALLGLRARGRRAPDEGWRPLSVAAPAPDSRQDDELRSRLLANVSHELRAPLNLILGYSQAAIETIAAHIGELPPSLQRDLEHIYRSGEHLIRLINDLLDLSRAEIGALDIFPEPIATRPFLAEAFHAIADLADGRGAVAWRLDLPARLPAIQADPLRLRQVLINLLDNARKFTGHGEVILGAEVQVPYLHIWVADTGRGIPPELQERIFDSFVTTARAEQREGAGLGLAIARQLVALHGGSMTLESELGKGSTFHIYLPLPSLRQERLVPSGEPAGTTSVMLKPLAPARLLDAIGRLRPSDGAGPILIVDDDPRAQALYRRLLDQHLPGYLIRSAADGREAIAMLAAETPDLIILDLMMPEVDGFALLAHVRADPQTRHVPVLVISGQLLSADDIQRLDQDRVIVHNKDLLTDSEAVEVIGRALIQTDVLPPQTSSLVKHAVAYIHQNHSQPLTRQEIASAIGVNKDYLTRIFRRELGLSPWDYLNRYRISRAKQLLRTSHSSIALVAAQVGFTDPSYFGRVFHKEVGCSPSAYREQG